MLTLHLYKTFSSDTHGKIFHKNEYELCTFYPKSILNHTTGHTLEFIEFINKYVLGKNIYSSKFSGFSGYFIFEVNRRNCMQIPENKI